MDIWYHHGFLEVILVWPHNRFINEHIAFLFQTCEQGPVSKEEFQELPENRPSCFLYWKNIPCRIPLEIEIAIKKLLREKVFIDDPETLISRYIYSALRDLLRKTSHKMLGQLD
jgi:hypothetical protein